MKLLPLCGFSFLAGLVDAVAGGGGLIQLPALFLFLPASEASATAAVFGTNKLASICGTSVAVLQYSRKVPMQWSWLGPTAFIALIFSAIGARTVTLLRPELLKPVVLTLLGSVALFTYTRGNLGKSTATNLSSGKQLVYGMLIGMVIGFYDGFFGPGTGSFLIFAFVTWFGLDFLLASASAKVVNLATNFSAVAYFAAKGLILYEYALPMGLCNIAGSAVGSRLAILKGSAFVRRVFLAVILALAGRMAWDLLRAR